MCQVHSSQLLHDISYNPKTKHIKFAFDWWNRNEKTKVFILRISSDFRRKVYTMYHDLCVWLHVFMSISFNYNHVSFFLYSVAYFNDELHWNLYCPKTKIVLIKILICRNCKSTKIEKNRFEISISTFDKQEWRMQVIVQVTVIKIHFIGHSLYALI